MKLDIDFQKKRIETILTISAGFFVIGGLKSWSANEIVYWPLYVIVPILVFGLSIKSVGVLITKIWFKLSELMGFFSSNIILSLFYYLFITPYSFIIRLFKKDKFRVTKMKSTFVTRDKVYGSKDLENPW
ncbi:MAG: SxtJ family membrane protein [Flavobacteriales bacterium]|nr:SxtJ family membrane protein [Flavobacteriales bacterium]